MREKKYQARFFDVGEPRIYFPLDVLANVRESAQ
jgi:hypothetical protein